jgi:hypothetical protein
VRRKIFEYNPNTDVIRWRYEDESHDDFGWPNYGRILKEKKKGWSILDMGKDSWLKGYKKWKRSMGK